MMKNSKEHTSFPRSCVGMPTLPRTTSGMGYHAGAWEPEANLHNIRRFYLLFPNRNAARTDLIWTHYRSLIRIEKATDDNPTIGLILCSEKSEAVAKYSVLADQKQLFSAKYLPYLPTEKELKQALQRERQAAIATLEKHQEDK